MPSPVYESEPAAMHHSLRGRATAAIVASTLLLGAHAAEARANSGRPHRVLTTAQRIKDLIVHHKPVHYDPYFDSAWFFPHSKKENLTTLPVVAKDHGHSRLFGLVQSGGHTLGSLLVLELPFEHQDAESGYDPQSNCGATPSEWGTVRLDHHHEPVTAIHYSNGKHIDAPIGQTEFNIHGLFSPAAMTPANCPTPQSSTGGAPISSPGLQSSGGAPLGR